MFQSLDDVLSSTKPTEMEDDNGKTLCDKTLGTIRFYLSNEIKTSLIAEICPNKL
jgi:hypothetical protein